VKTLLELAGKHDQRFDKQDKRISALEKERWLARGALAVGIFIATKLGIAGFPPLG
jgi:hypothetical protein